MRAQRIDGINELPHGSGSGPPLGSSVDGAPCWHMPRNCALTPAQTFTGYGALCALMLPMGAAWWLLGYPLVAAFVLVELAVVAAFLCCYARHAGDAETLVLRHDGRLQVRQCVGQQCRVVELDVAALRVSLPAGRPDLISLGARDTSVLVGRHVPSARRRQLALELQRALRTPSAGFFSSGAN
jgi:uncharacterized membrane protein